MQWKSGGFYCKYISSGDMDELMLQTVAALQVPYICMHMKGTSQNMQQMANYEDVTKEGLDFLFKNQPMYQSRNPRCDH